MRQLHLNGPLLDRIEKIVFVTLFSLLVARMVRATIETENYLNLAFVFAEATTVFFVLIRRSAQEISAKPLDWVLGWLGTGLPLLAAPNSGTALVAPAVAGLLMMAGLGLQIVAKLTLRRSFGVIAANRGIKASGPYRLVRHPTYAGYMVMQIGFLLSGPTLWNVALFLVDWCVQIGRIVAEERVLGRDEAYRALARQTRYRLAPGIF